ncbi:MAG: TrmH family RNA methyltransferase [Oscillospiraceae bacterium]
MTVSSRKNDAVRRFRELSRDRKIRAESGLFAAEGDHLCGELSRSEHEVTLFLYTERAAEKYPQTANALLKKAHDSVVITEELAEYISDTRSPQGLFAVGKLPAAAALPDNAGRIVVLDGVQDPGNVGTVIRTAEALGIGGALLLNGCADIWSPKTMRASMGSVFRLPCVVSDGAAEIERLISRGFSVYGAKLDESALRLGEFKFPEKSAVVIGSEGSGISPEISDSCTHSLYIPISGAESLNAAAAAAIILWEFSR